MIVGLSARKYRDGEYGEEIGEEEANAPCAREVEAVIPVGPLCKIVANYAAPYQSPIFEARWDQPNAAHTHNSTFRVAVLEHLLERDLVESIEVRAIPGPRLHPGNVFGYHVCMRVRTNCGSQLDPEYYASRWRGQPQFHPQYDYVARCAGAAWPLPFAASALGENLVPCALRLPWIPAATTFRLKNGTVFDVVANANRNILRFCRRIQ
jgi:hypothetical protein